MTTKTILIAEDYAKTPAGRYRDDGPFSGEKFREEWLIPALNDGNDLIIDLNGTLGFGSSFLEEAFGGLVRKGFTGKDLKERIKIRTSIPTYEKRIWRYIKEEAERSQRVA